MNRLICIRQNPGTNVYNIPDLVVGEQYTIAGVQTGPNFLTDLSGKFYSLWEMKSGDYYHESLFATLSDDFETERILKKERVPATHESDTLHYFKGIRRSIDEQGYED